MEFKLFFFPCQLEQELVVSAFYAQIFKYFFFFYVEYRIAREKNVHNVEFIY